MRNTIVGQTGEPHRSTPARTGGNPMFAAMRHRNFQLYFGGQRDNILYHSHIGHFNEKGALKWQDTNKVNGKVDKWNWKEIEQTSRKLKTYLHNKIAVKKIGSYGILPGADRLNKNGIKLWGI